MNQTKVTAWKLILWAIFASVLVNVFFGRMIAAKISTWPLLNRFKLLNPQTPIVITQRQEIKVLDQSSLEEAVNRAHSKLALIVTEDGGGLTTSGAAINLTSDGLFLTASEFLPPKAAQKFFVVLSDGQISEGTLLAKDKATDLAVVKASLSTSAAAFAVSKDFRAGDMLAAMQNSLNNQLLAYEPVYVKASQQDAASVLSSDFPSRKFTVSAPIQSGWVIIDREGEVAGLSTSSGVISSDVIRKFVSLYFTGRPTSRISLGINYKNVGKVESDFFKIPQGAKVLEVLKSSPAQSAGILEGDIITAIDGEVLGENRSFEEALEKYAPGANAKLTVYRQGGSLEISFKIGDLKQ